MRRLGRTAYLTAVCAVLIVLALAPPACRPEPQPESTKMLDYLLI